MASPGFSPFDSTPDSSRAEQHSVSRSQVGLAQGIAALKRKDYPEAIRQFQAIQPSSVGPADYLQAQMGLVKAYARTEQLEAAIALCQQLQQSGSAKVQAWATQTEQGLTQQISSPPVADTTGFVAFDPTKSRSPAVPAPSSLPSPPAAPSAAPSSTPPKSAPKSAPKSEISVSSAQSVPVADDRSDQDDPEAAEPIPDALPPYQPTWKQAGRVSQWKPLKSPKLTQLWMVQGATAVALFFLVRFGLSLIFGWVNDILSAIDWPINLQPIQWLYGDPKWVAIALLAILWALSPWLWDGLLQRFYGQQALSTTVLTNHSAEAIRLIRRVANQQGWPVPHLKVIPNRTPLIFTYGNLPRWARISVSQGLLDQLAEDELAALYAREVSHLQRWDFSLLSSLSLMAQIPYLGYWQLAQWGDRQKQPLFRFLISLCSAISYGLYWPIRWLGLWLSRFRTHYSDRAAASLTGNPNGLARALVKLAIGTAMNVEHQGHTSFLTESLDVLTPLEHRQAIAIGSLYPHVALSSLLVWDYTNSYRFWLAFNQAHPPLGERLYLLTRYAQYWQLEPEFDLRPPTEAEPRPRNLPDWLAYWRPFALQAAPWLGILAGLSLALLLWLLGSIAGWLSWQRLDWLAGDRALLQGCVLIGFGMGTWLRVNVLFPNLTPGSLRDQPLLSQLLEPPQRLPVDTIPVRLQGKLLGRTGLSNGLHQNLMLQTEQGMIALHHLSALGPAGNLWLRSRPERHIGQSVQVMGWFHRGVIGWVDVDTLKTPTGRPISTAQVPLWSTLIGGLAIIWGLFLIYQGN